MVLHALRDRLLPEEAAGFAAQLPLPVRGAVSFGHPGPAAEVARAVFRAVNRHMSAGEVADVIAALPADIRRFGREPARRATR